ncbi:MAG TPA: hypothetical protein VI300_04960, partial [Solirubrobacter sp.]
MRLGLGGLAGIAAACVVAAPAHAADEFGWRASLQPDGRPSLNVASAPAGATLEVFRCPGGGACEAQSLPIVLTYGVSAVDVSGAQPGDVFEGRWTKDGAVVSSGRTKPWIGPATPTGAPAVLGTPIVGSTITSTAGTWVGGWGDTWSGGVGTELVACRSAAGIDCRRLGGAPETVNASDLGGYLFALSSYGSGFYSGPIPPIPPPPPTFPAIGPNTAVFTASAPVGPIVRPPVPPTATLRSRALRRNHQLSLGRVTCPAACKVDLTVSGGGKAVRRTLTVTGTRALTIAPR